MKAVLHISNILYFRNCQYFLLQVTDHVRYAAVMCIVITDVKLICCYIQGRSHRFEDVN
jgi:hypothetical protein